MTAAADRHPSEELQRLRAEFEAIAGKRGERVRPSASRIKRSANAAVR